MSAALQLPMIWEEVVPQQTAPKSENGWKKPPATVGHSSARKRAEEDSPVVSLGFYRKHTESMLRRYLYASMQVGRAPSVLSDPVSRGWCSSRPIRTFEDAVIFVLDVERCMNQIGSLERQMLVRVVLQEYTQAEAAQMLGMSVRTISYKFPKALDALTEKLIESGLLVLPN